MEVDSSPGRKTPIPPGDRILQRLAQHGVPQEFLDLSQLGLVLFVRGNKSLVPELVSSILPSDPDVSEAQRPSKKGVGGGTRRFGMKDLIRESLLWLKFLMFDGDPHVFLKNLAQEATGQRSMCGAVWEPNDLVYHCRTCEHDSTCAICVPCFLNGNHEGHDYSIKYTGGGCCDCGDETAWSRDGFCSKHKGSEKIQPLPIDLENSIRPVLDVLLAYWRDKVLLVEGRRPERQSDRNNFNVMVANKVSTAIIAMMLEFCNCSGSLLIFISRRIFECSNLLGVLVRAERHLDKKVVTKLHELLLKLLGDPPFKYEFAKEFIAYYSFTVKKIIEECSDSTLEKYSLLSTFSVQIFTVPILAPQLVRDVNLLSVLFGCLRDLFLSCVGEYGCLQASKWVNLYQTTFRLVEDTRFVMGHDEVPKYIAHERPDISRTWIRLLSFVQGMDSQKRLVGIVSEEENEDLHLPFSLTDRLGNVSHLLVEGATSVAGPKEMKDVTVCCSGIQDLVDGETRHHAMVGSISEESSACAVSSRNSISDRVSQHGGTNFDRGSCSSVPSSVIRLVFECLKAIESWLGPDMVVINSSSSDTSSSCDSNTRKKLFRIKNSANNSRVYRTSMSMVDTNELQVAEGHDMLGSSSSIQGMTGSFEVEGKEVRDQSNTSANVTYKSNFFPEHACTSGVLDDSLVDSDSTTEQDAFSILNLADWPDITYDVSSHEISFHIPLHRLLSLLLRKVMRTYYTETGKLDRGNDVFELPSPGHHHDFFAEVLGDVHPFGFSAFVMEHPLRLRVFCSQVRAGMWRRNGDAAILISDWYHSVQWLEQGLEFDLFLLQCCAALAPPELFVKRIQERFGLLGYTSLNLPDYTRYESVIVQEMLTLIIQIVQERRYCGFSATENLRRELVYKLAVGDSTRSQLVKSLPRDLSKNDQLQNVLNMLAVYSNPSGLNQGKYSLRNAHWKELDLYHPRWNSRDLQLAEERYLRFCKVSAADVQRPRWTRIFEPLNQISRIATSKAVLQIVRAVLFYAVFAEKLSISCAPDGVLITALHLLSLALDICEKQNKIYNKRFGASFRMAHMDEKKPCVGILQNAENSLPMLAYVSEEFDAGSTDESVIRKNQSMLSLLVSLMRKFKEETHGNYAESRQFNFSSFIEDLLKKLAQLSADCMSNLKQLAPDIICETPNHSPSINVQSLASISDNKDQRAKARERQAVILEKMRAEQAKFIACLKSAPTDEPDMSRSKEEISFTEVNHFDKDSSPVCSFCRELDSKSPLCFLILLQKSRLTSFVERGPPSWEDVGQSDKEFLSVRKERLIDLSASDSISQARIVQNAGLQFLHIFKEQEPDSENIRSHHMLHDTGLDTTQSLDMLENEIYQSVKGDIGSPSDALKGEDRCSTSQIPLCSMESNTLSCLLRKYVESLSRKTSRKESCSMYNLHLSNVSSRATVPSAKINRFGPIDCDGIHISSCGHAVHLECHYRYILSQKQRNIRRPGFEGGRIVDPDKGELLCPVCRRFSNSILPVMSSVANKSLMQPVSAASPTSNAVFSASPVTDKSLLHLRLALSLIQSTSKVVGQDKFSKMFSEKLSETIEPALEPALCKLCMLYYPHSYDDLLASDRHSPSLMLWDMLRYSLASTEIASREWMKTGSIGSASSLETLYGEQHSSNKFILSLLLRVAQTTRHSDCLEVLLRFRGIQLLAGSICSGVSRDNIFSQTDKQKGEFSCLLGHDDKGEAFPDTHFWKRAADPILAHDSFSSLMWVLFCLPLPFISSIEYLIPLVHLFYVVCVVQAMITCYGQQWFDASCFGDCPLSDVCKAMGESELARKYFLSNYVDSSFHSKDTIHRLTFPYLRRCTLLLKLLQSLALISSSDSSDLWEGSSPSLSNVTIDCPDHLMLEINGVRELEGMFQIPSLESIFKDETVYGLALKWCEHFYEDFRTRRLEGVIFFTPAVPFKLMQLPLLYQDLLQRYIKLQCSDCKSIPEKPALCLLCGKLCSLGYKSCCSESKCFNHAMVCGAGIGVFLLVRKTTILLQRSSRQTDWPSPYLDAFGEEDRGMSRGKPLYLCEERYAALTYLVVSHGFDRSSEVLRQTTISFDGSD